MTLKNTAMWCSSIILPIEILVLEQVCLHQGCQIFLKTIHQNGEKLTKLPIYYQMTIKYNKCPYNAYSKFLRGLQRFYSLHTNKVIPFSSKLLLV
jgi:hypothetical protein